MTTSDRHDRAALLQMRSLDLDAKVRMAILRIQQWYEHWDGQVYVAASGGLDSTVLAHIVRSVYSDVPMVFCDTGLEYPENRRQCREMGAEFIRPAMGFREVLEKYGYPVVSKRVAQYIAEVRRAKGETATKRLRLTGYNSAGQWSQMSMIPLKWQFLIRAPFNVSPRCCDVMKKRPARKYQRISGRMPLLGTRVEEGSQREQTWYRTGCNAFDIHYPRSAPLSIWTHADVWEYIRAENVPYSELYDMGYQRSGCMFCMFGVHLECGPNRFQRMAKTHPKQRGYCIDKLGCGKVLKYIGVDYEPHGPLFASSTAIPITKDAPAKAAGTSGGGV